jgi:hypothetical protein
MCWHSLKESISPCHEMKMKIDVVWYWRLRNRNSTNASSQLHTRPIYAPETPRPARAK